MSIWKILRGLGLTLVILGERCIIIGLGGIWYAEGFSAMLSVLNPFNIVNYLTMIIMIAPGAFLYQYSNKKIRGY